MSFIQQDDESILQNFLDYWDLDKNEFVNGNKKTILKKISKNC